MKTLIATAVLGTVLGAGSALADPCYPLEYVGRAVTYTQSGAQVAELQLETLVEKISETQLRTTTTLTPVDDPDDTETNVCVSTKVTDVVSTVSCEDGAFGTAAAIGSNGTRRLFQPDGSVRISGSAQDDAGDRRRNITTRFDAQGNIQGYIRETLRLVSTGGNCTH